ncbi:MAG: hypothetical protein GX448_01370 [Planctomycetes bacterium]|nr:hypothetical protein [Planctomycetota bacterium]
MTRREFMAKASSFSALCVGLPQIARRVAPRGVVRAAKPFKYSGRIVPMRDIHTESKWSG